MHIARGPKTAIKLGRLYIYTSGIASRIISFQQSNTSLYFTQNHRLLLLVGIKTRPRTRMIIKMILHTVLEKGFGVENPSKVESREIPTKEGGLIPGSSNSIGGSLL